MAKEIKCEVLKTIKDEPYRNGSLKLRIVRWNNGKPSLEKREFWMSEEDVEKTGKAKGLNASDFEALLAEKDEIQKLLTPAAPTSDA